ncbi:MAG TPA: PIN domain-containing protein [Deltaproteobacteria bacterium]|nr:PIN domain-containing protein [Deltaproteobacteria bacterium]
MLVLQIRLKVRAPTFFHFGCGFAALDNCTFKRPFDTQERVEVKFEAEAKIHIQDKIRKGALVHVWSYILEFENAINPFPVRKLAILQWKRIAKYNVIETEKIVKKAVELQNAGLKSKDALHIACAIEAKADYFITTDKTILKKLKDYKEISVVDPVSFLMAPEGSQ